MIDKIKLADRDMEVRRQFDKEIAKFNVEMTRRSNPMKEVKGKDGAWYLCDESADENMDLTAQGCFEADRIPVTANG